MWRRPWFTASVAVAGIIIIGGVLMWPVTTSQGVNYEVAVHRLPLYLKATEFIGRSAQYQQIAKEIVKAGGSDESRTLAVFDWTLRNVRPVPDGFPVVDDHILNIITRGYGTGDQRADVFATLTVYAGVPAFWAKVPKGLPSPGVIVTFVKLNGRWRVFDAAAGIAYRTESGELATVEDLAGKPLLVPATVRDLEVEAGISYADILTRASMPRVPRPLRAELQMPSSRLWHEVKEVVGVESDDESER